MNMLWNRIDAMPWHPVRKFKTVLAIASCFCSLLGLLVWLALRTWVFSGWDWMLCFLGYPMIFSWLIVFLYSCSHRFKDENPLR